ncbi:MAG TPA: hypothetical protein VF185_00350 [Patescibacteria group bacterium]
MVEQILESQVKTPKFIDARKVNEEERQEQIEKKVGFFKNIGLSDSELEIIRKAEKEKYGSLEGCGCLNCAKRAVKDANDLVSSFIPDVRVRQWYLYHLVFDKTGRGRVVGYEGCPESITPANEMAQIPVDQSSDDDYDDFGWLGF